MAHRQQSTGRATRGSGTPPTVSIYQNPEYVAGVLQQVYGQPLLTDYTSEGRRDSSDAKEGTKSAGGDVRGSASAPLLGNIEAKIGADYQRRVQAQSSIGSTTTSNWRYTQAYYLYAARDALHANELVHTVTGRNDASGLTPGDFIEFTASFAPSQVIALLDIVTPELVAAITRYQVQQQRLSNFSGGDLETVQNFKLRLDADVEAAGAIARAATEAMRIDFRSPATREFFGRIGHGLDRVTAVTICDKAYFVVEDEDRILDGTFTVLGKVTTGLVEDEPALARNKVLGRFKPEAVDELVQKLNDEVSGQTRRVADIAVADDEHDDRLEADDESNEEEPLPGDLFDFTLDSRVKGASIKVIPVAIYV